MNTYQDLDLNLATFHILMDLDVIIFA